MTTPAPTRWGLRFLGLGYLTMLLLIPLVMIFIKAFDDGISGFTDTLTSPDFLHALKLSLITVVIARSTGVLEVVGSRRERARDHEGGVDAVADQLAGVGDREGVTGGLGGEVRPQERRATTAGAGAANPHEQPGTTFAHVRKRRPIDPMGPEDVDVVHLGHLLGRERLGGAQHHVTGVVDDHVDALRLIDDPLDRAFDRPFLADVQLERPQIQAIGLGVGGEPLDGLRIVALRVAHARVDRVAGSAQRANAHRTEPARCTADDDDLARRHQTSPPFARTTCPLIQ